MTRIRKLEIPSSEFCPISGDWYKSGIPNLVRISVIRLYGMLQNTRVAAFTVSELFRENQQWWINLLPHTHTHTHTHTNTHRQRLGLNWQHSNSYLMPQTTDLFCHKVLIFVKTNMLISFNPFVGKYWEKMTFYWSKGIVFPLNYRGTFLWKKVFMTDWGTNFFDKYMEEYCSTWEFNDQFMLNLKIFLNHEGTCAWR